MSRFAQAAKTSPAVFAPSKNNMAQRSVARMGLSPDSVEVLERHKFKTSKDILSRTRGELVHALDMGTNEIDTMLDIVCAKVRIDPKA